MIGMSPEDLAIWNRLGLVETNGTVTLSLDLFQRALLLARLQPSPDAPEDDQ